MNKTMGKRTGITVAVIVTVIIVAVIFSTTVSGAMTLNQAKEIASKYVPQGAKFEISEDEDSKYEVMFYDEKNRESYEVEVVKETKKVRKIETQLDNNSGSTEVKLTEQDAEKIVRERFEDVNSVNVFLSQEHGIYEYEVSFKGNDFYGSADVHPVNGKILESTLKFGTAVVIPTDEKGNNSADNKLLTANEAKEKAIKEAGGGVIKDVELERENGKYFYEIEVVKDGREFNYYVDALSGEVTLEYEHDSYFEYDEYDDYDDYHDFDDFDDENDDAYSLSENVKISKEKVRNIVLKKVPGAKIVYISMDNDDGITVYEGKAILGEFEYEFEINADSGAIVEWDKEYIDEWDD